MWKQSVKQKGKDMFSEMLSILSMKQQQNDNEHPDAQVTKDNLFDLLKAMNPGEPQESEEGDIRLLCVWRVLQEQRRSEGTLHDYAL